MTTTIRSILLLSFANLAVSFWGGLLLSFGLTFFGNFQSIRFDSVLAYLVGSFLAFSVIVVCRKRRRLPLPQVSLSLLLPVLSLLLLVKYFGTHGTALEVAFAVSFCVYFGLGSCLRAFRSDLSAHVHRRGLMVSELAYSTGYLIGLLVPVAAFNIETILLGQLICSPLVLLADYTVYRNRILPSSKPSAANLSADRRALVVPFLLFFGMTLCVQISFQRLGSLLTVSGPIAAFELGVTLAPIVALFASAGLVSVGRSLFLNGFNRNVSFFACLVLTVSLAPVSLYLVAFRPSDLFAGMALLAVCSFCYEYLALVLLAHVGKKPGQVMVILGLGGVLCSLSYWALLNAHALGAMGVVYFSTACAVLALLSGRVFCRNFDVDTATAAID